MYAQFRSARFGGSGRSPRFTTAAAVAGVALAVLLAGCRGKSSSASASASSSAQARAGTLSATSGNVSGPSEHIYGLAPSEPVAAECKAYAEAVLRCVADPHFQQNAKPAQLSALAQMMNRMNLTAVAEPERAAALTNAAAECGDALSTLEVSSKSACPAAF